MVRSKNKERKMPAELKQTSDFDQVAPVGYNILITGIKLGSVSAHQESALKIALMCSQLNAWGRLEASIWAGKVCNAIFQLDMCILNRAHILSTHTYSLLEWSSPSHHHES